MNYITFLGTGTSTGIPQIGCSCKVCTSTDPKDKRLRCAAYISINGNHFLIDAGPDLRQQLISNNIINVDAILLTHEHYDHVGGLDDIRPLGKVEIYGEKNVLNAVKRNMPYSFTEKKYPGVPRLQLNEIDIRPFSINGNTIIPIRIMHANLPILGFRIGNIAYLTDIKTLPDEEFNKLQNLNILIINALRIGKHISHLSLDEAIHIAQIIGAKQTFFIHASHDLGLHEEIEQKLPLNIHYAYDNLTIYF